MKREDCRVIAVLPAFCEAETIQGTIEQIRPFVDGVVVVDDGSSDETGECARGQGVIVCRHLVNRGQGAALRTGTDAARRLGADMIIHVDADGQHDPASIPVLLRPLLDETTDVVFGSRFLGVDPVGMPKTRRAVLFAGRAFNALAVGVPRHVTDPQSGFRAMNRHAANTISFTQDRMAHCSEILRMVTRSHLRWCEVPVRVTYSDASLEKGQKSWHAFRIAWELFLGAFMK